MMISIKIFMVELQKFCFYLFYWYIYNPLRHLRCVKIDVYILIFFLDFKIFTFMIEY